MAGESFAVALHELRAGNVDFRAIETGHRGVFVSIARCELRRWPQSHLTVDDLVQEALYMAWRVAVEYWDPSRGVDLDAYVRYRVGLYVRRVMMRAAGRREQGRVKSAVPVRLTDEMEIVYCNARACCDVDRVELGEVLIGSVGELETHVAVGVVMGMDVAAIAAHLYSDPVCRLRYRFDSMRNARHKVRRAVELAARVLGEYETEMRR